MRYRIKFAKTEHMRFTGNLDLHRTLERTMRRANLPLAYSQGFNPRPKLTLASALPLGYTSEGEVAEFWLKEDMEIAGIKAALDKAAPPGVLFLDLEVVDQRAPKPQTTITGSTFVATLQQPNLKLDENVTQLMASKEIIKEKIRKGKKRVYNLRDLIYKVTILPESEDGKQRLELYLRAGQGATGRPDEVLMELGIDPLGPKIHRKKLIFQE